uniref:Putative member of the intramitochondrial sorting protein family n=1 Tax=Panstrongylus lignarius TaxID=156445 RepID=A0A224XJK4_9HEMI
MKIWTSEHTFNHPWETVAQAAWRKYPNPMNPAVIGTDVVDRKVVEGVLHTHRLVSSKWGLPRWVQALIGPANICYASEHSIVDPNTRSMTLKTRNLTFGKYVAVDEMVHYQPHPEDTGKTLLRQEAVVTVQGVPLNSYMEDLLTTTIMSNAGKGRQAIEWVIDKINKEVKELKNNAVKSTDEILTQTKRSIGGITTSARKSMDGISLAAKKSLSDLSSKDMPKI